MAPQSGKRKYRENHPMPIWIPLPRPCIRSMNMPGPYYMPVPEMCMQWLPPPYFPKPMCHCANENYCTTSNCKNSAECHKIHPDFCPHGLKDDGIDLHQNHNKQNVENSIDEQVSSISDIDVCKSCGASFGNKKGFEYTKRNQQGSIQTPSYSFKEPTNFDSASSPYISQVQRKEVSNSLPLSSNMPAEIDENAPKSVLTNKDDANKIVSTQHPAYSCVNSSCQTRVQLGESSNLPTQGRNSTLLMSKSIDAVQRTSTSMSSATSYSADVKNTVHRLPPLNTESSQRNVAKNGLGCTNCSAVKRNDSESIDSSSNTEFPVLSEEPAVNRTRDKIYIEQLPEHLSHARSQRTCCSDLPKNYQMGPAINTRINDKTLKKSSKIRNTSECGCSSTQIHIDKAKNQQRKSLSSIRKASECECNSTKISGHTSENKLRKSISNTRKVSKCGCPSQKKVEKTKNYSKNSLSKIKSVPKCSCSVTKLPAKKSSAKIITPKPSVTKNNIKTSSAKIPAADMTLSSASNLKPLSCQCKFPPAFSHLSCSSNLSGNCRCSSDPSLKKSVE